MRRFSPKMSLTIGLAVAALVMASCGSKKANDTFASESTVAAADTTPASVDTTAAASPAETTVLATTPAVEAASTDAVALDTTATNADPAAAAGSTRDLIIGQMVVGMTGAATADPADVKCISNKISEKDLTSIMSSVSGGGAGNPDAMKSLIKAVFSCKPKGLADNFVKSTFTDMPADVTDKQKACLANGLFDLIGRDDSVIDAITANADKMPDSLKSKFEGTVKECVPSGASRDSLIKELNK